MRTVLVAVCAALLLCQARHSTAFEFNKNALLLSDALMGHEPEVAFKKWQVKHNKQYASVQVEKERFAVWLDNAQRVVARNAEPGRRLKLGLNALADLSPQEFRAKLLAPRPFQTDATREVAARMGGDSAAGAAASTTVLQQLQEREKKSDSSYFSWRYEHVVPRARVDWREAGVMGPVRSQHAHNWSCGGCWAFATAGIVEASSALSSGVMHPASEQQLIDCDRKHDHGCNGGDFHNALDYIIYNKGLTTEDNYPYAGRTNACDTRKERDHQVKIDDWESVPPFNETALVQALSMRPVVTAICCGSNLDDWHHYDGGVFDLPCCHDKLELDHAIVLAGYDETPEGEKYYLLKNSWSEEWGEGGYMRIARGVGPAPFVSQCGLASMPTMVFRGPKPPAPTFWPQEGPQQQQQQPGESVSSSWGALGSLMSWVLRPWVGNGLASPSVVAQQQQQQYASSVGRKGVV